MKYEHVPEYIDKIYEKLKAQHFPYLANAKILFLVNKKKMVQKGNIALGKIMKPSELVRFLSKDEAPEDGYDYIMLLDGKLLSHCEEGDIERVLRHELRHTFFDSDSNTNPYKLVDHDFSDFYAEVELNKDDPTWAQRVSQSVSLMYDQEKDQKNAPSKSPF
ncbi:MAG: putative metallopeptidase [Desulfobaccales bacterium]